MPLLLFAELAIATAAATPSCRHPRLVGQRRLVWRRPGACRRRRNRNRAGRGRCRELDDEVLDGRAAAHQRRQYHSQEVALARRAGR